MTVKVIFQLINHEMKKVITLKNLKLKAYLNAYKKRAILIL